MFKKVIHATSQLRQSASHFDSTLWEQASRARLLHNRSLFSLEDILYWGLTDPAISRDDYDAYISREARVRLQRYFNDRSLSWQVNNKLEFYRLCKEYGLSTPAVPGVLKMSARSQQAASYPELPPLDLRALAPGEYIVKPSLGHKGEGIFFFSKTHDDAFEFDDEELTQSAAMTRLQQSASDDLVVQEVASPCNELAMVSGTRSLQSVRVVTFLGDSGSVSIVMARFKFLVGNNRVDNFDDGKTGNLIADVDTNTGRVTTAYRKHRGEVGLQCVTKHPDTHSDLRIQIPDWPALCDLVFRAARCFPALRLLAWDVGLTDRGPTLLESNENWEIFPISPSKLPPDMGHAWRDAKEP